MSILFFITTILSLTSCSDSNFLPETTSSVTKNGGESGDANLYTEGRNTKVVTNSTDRFGDGSDNYGNNPNGSDLYNGNGKNTDTGDGDESEKCRFDIRSYSEIVPNGPALKINPLNFDGNWEGDHYVFDFDAWEDFNTATGSVSVSGAIVPASALKALQRVSGLNVAWALDAPSSGWGVKHTYNGVLRNGKSEDCSVEINESNTPIFDRPHDGCFAMSTRILMGDGRYKSISLVKKGDLVFNPFTRKNSTVEKVLEGPEIDKRMIRITTSKGDLLVTEQHPFPTFNLGVVRAHELKQGMKIIGLNHDLLNILSTSKLPLNKKQIVRNLVISSDSSQMKDHVIVAEGIATGDFIMQSEPLTNYSSGSHYSLNQVLDSQHSLTNKYIDNWKNYR